MYLTSYNNKDKCSFDCKDTYYSHFSHEIDHSVCEKSRVRRLAALSFSRTRGCAQDPGNEDQGNRYLSRIGTYELTGASDGEADCSDEAARSHPVSNAAIRRSCDTSEYERRNEGNVEPKWRLRQSEEVLLGDFRLHRRRLRVKGLIQAIRRRFGNDNLSLFHAATCAKIVVGAHGAALPARAKEGNTLNAAAIFASVAADIEHQLHSYHPQPPVSMPTISSSVAAALLQKAIRRGRADLALAAASLLLHTSPDRLWRRLSVIAVEDVGVGDIDAIYMTIAASGHWRRLARRLGEWRLASFIVSRLATAAKCRATDDLYVVTQDCPAWNHDRLELAELPFPDLLDVIAGDGPIERRAIAARYAVGTAGSSSAGALAKRPGYPGAVFDLLCEITPHTLAEVARGAYRLTAEPFCTFLPLLYRAFDSSKAELASDDFLPETMVADLPSWALDGFSHEGRRALARFLSTDCSTARWLGANISPADRMKMLRHAQFRVEAGLVVDRLIWPTGHNLRRQADLHSWPFPPEDAATLLALMRGDIGILNRAREASYGR